MGVEPKIGVVNPPAWMVKIMENPIKMDDLGVFPMFLETPKSKKGMCVCSFFQMSFCWRAFETIHHPSANKTGQEFNTNT